jgi:hypothetical protein
MSALPITILGSSASTGVGMAIGGIVVVLVISAVFYVIGRGEDRDRARARPTTAPDDGPDEARAPREAPHGGAAPSRLPPRARMRRRR